MYINEGSSFAFSQSNQIAEKSGFAFDFFSPIILPAFIGVGGYILKSIYEFIVERQNRKRKLIEEQLKHFYWPILTRLEHNNATWRVILNKKEQNSELQNSIVNYVQYGCRWQPYWDMSKFVRRFVLQSMVIRDEGIAGKFVNLLLLQFRYIKFEGKIGKLVSTFLSQRSLRKLDGNTVGKDAIAFTAQDKVSRLSKY